MPIIITIPDDYFTADELKKLGDLFETKTEPDLFRAIEDTTLAALDEYVQMLLGKSLPSRADEIRQHRLNFLIKRYFKTRIPTEAEVSRLFQLTQNQSRSLVRSVITRFHYELEQQTRNTLSEIVKQAQFDKEDNEYRVVIQSENVLEELNRIIETEAPKLDPVKKIRNMSRTFSISKDSYRALCSHFGIK